MSHSLSTTNVLSPLINAVVLAAPAATFAGGYEAGLKRPVKMDVSPVSVGMTSGNDFLDFLKVKVETDLLHNRIADLAALYELSQDVVQSVHRTAGGSYYEFLGETLHDETALGLDFEYVLKPNEAYLKLILEGEMGVSVFKSCHKTSSTLEWSATENPAYRHRPGISHVTVGGADYGALKDSSVSIKSRSTKVQGGRSLLLGTDVMIDLVLAQSAKGDQDAALDAANGNDSVIVYARSGDQVKLTTLRGGKIPTIELGDEHLIKIAIKAFFAKGSDRVDFTGGTNTIAEFTLLDNVANG